MRLQIFVSWYILQSIHGALNNSTNSNISEDVIHHITQRSIISGGIEATEGFAPYQCSLQRAHFHFCGCAVINPHFVTTASHCVIHLTSTIDVTVMVGSNDVKSGGTHHKVERIILHEHYYNPKRANDIALAKVKEPIQYTDKVRPIVLEDKEVPDGTMVQLTGWGRLTREADGELPRKLQYINLYILGMDRCRISKVNATLYDSMICTNGLSGRGVCDRDSGGPLVHDNKLVGVVNFGYETCDFGEPEVYAKISYFADWIKKHSLIEVEKEDDCKCYSMMHAFLDTRCVMTRTPQEKRNLITECANSRQRFKTEISKQVSFRFNLTDQTEVDPFGYLDDNEVTSFIKINRTDAPEGLATFQCSLQYSEEHRCGCAVINPQFVLTASNCVVNRHEDRIRIMVGSNTLRKGGTYYKAERLIPHEHYNALEYANNIALVKVKGPIQFNEKVRPIELGVEEVPVGAEVQLTGWGYEINAPVPNKLRYVNLHILDRNVCKKAYSGRYVQDTHFCTINLSAEACKADNGGPLVYENKVVGIVNFERPCCKGHPDVYANVSYFADWIRKHSSLEP